MSDTLRILQSSLPDAATQALIAMRELAEGSLCIATQREIAGARGVSYTAIKRPMRQLQGCGVVEMLKSGVYRIDLSQLPMQVTGSDTEHVREKVTQSDQKVTQSDQKDAESDQKDAESDQKVTQSDQKDAESDQKVTQSDQKDAESDHSQPQKDPFPLPPFLPPSSPCIPNNPPIIPPCSLPQKACSAWKSIFRAAYGDPLSELPDEHPAVSERHLRYHMAADWSITLMEQAEEAIESYRIPSAVRRKLDRDRHEVVQDYANTYRLLEEQDGYDWEEVRFGIHWLFTESDWLRNGYIASVNALRRKTRSGDRSKFDVILTQAKADHDYEGPNSTAEVGSKTDRKQRGKRDDESLKERYQRNYEAALRAVSA